MDAYQPVCGKAPPTPPTIGRPQVFVADPTTIGTAELWGVWLDPTQPYADLRGLLAGASLSEDFVIIDQVGFGPIMLDEVMDLAELRVLALTALVFGRCQP